MSILLQVTEETNRQGLNTPPITKLYGVPNISLVRDNGVSATIMLDGRRNNEERIVSESYATVLALISSGYTDLFLSLTQTNGSPLLVKASKIIEVYDNENSKGVVRYRDNQKSEDDFYTVEENVETIIALTPSSEWKEANVSPTFELAIGGTITTPGVCLAKYRNIGANTVVVDWRVEVGLSAGVTIYFFGPTPSADLPPTPVGVPTNIYRATGVIDGFGEAKQFLKIEVTPFGWTLGANDLVPTVGGNYVVAGQITYQTK